METAKSILRSHLHGLSDEQFEVQISQFPLNEVMFAMKSYAQQYANSLPVYRICNHCNTEFELPIVNGLSERTSAFQNCTHCGKRNDTWISIKLTQPL